jgi:hypothetical protein
VFGLVPRGAVLRSATVRGIAPDPWQARQRLLRALAEVEWSPPGLPPLALLIVRTLAPAEDRGQRPFAARVSAALAEKARRARRPWTDADAAQADAVWFADEAELVACLARDQLRGALGDGWWWRDLLGSGGPREFLRRNVLPRGDVLTPAIALLAGRASAVAWIAGFEPTAAAEAVHAVARAYGLTLLETADPPTPLPVAPGGHRSTRAAPGRRARPVESTARRRLVAAVPELLQLPPGSSQRRLLATALVLARAPAWARTPELRVALRAVDRVDEVGVSENGASPGDRQPSRVARRTRSGSDEHAVPRLDRAGSRTAGPVALPAGSPRPVPASIEATGPPGGEASPEHVAAAPSSEPPVAAGLDGVAAREQAALMRIDEPRSGAPTAPAAPALPDQGAVRAPVLFEPAQEAGAQVATRFGGVFYLLNAALALGLYGDFTTPRTIGLALLPWEWLALVGRAWFGRDFTRDPVWELLAGLAGRRGHDEPGRDFIAPVEWTVDRSWLLPWSEGAVLRTQRTRTRRRVLHPAGFAVRDAPLERRGSGSPAQDRARWLARLREYLVARLALALAEPDTSRVPGMVCRHRAQVFVTDSRVQVHLSLTELPLPIRMAGLDRDPGWVPAAGRTIAFHFQ